MTALNNVFVLFSISIAANDINTARALRQVNKNYHWYTLEVARDKLYRKYGSKFGAVAIKLNNFYAIEWLHRNNMMDIHYPYLEFAVYNDTYDMVKWLFNHNYRRDERWTINTAASLGKLPMIKFLIEGKCEFQTASITYAISSKHKETAQYLFDHLLSSYEDVEDARSQLILYCGRITILQTYQEAIDEIKLLPFN